MAYSNITITTNPGLFFRQYDFIQVAHDSENYIIGRVVSYNSSTGVLVLTPLIIEGSGSFSSWEISLTGDPGIDGTSGSSGLSGSGTSSTSGTSGTSPNIQFSGYPFGIPRFTAGGNNLYSDNRLTFDGRTLSIDPLEFSSGGNPIYRIIYHNDGTAGTAGIVVRGPVIGQSYTGIIENRVPHDYQHQYVVGSNNIAHIDAQGLHVQQALIADNGIYFENLEFDSSQSRFLVWDPSTSGGLQGKVKWTTSGAAGTQGPAGTSGSSGQSGTSGTSGSTNLNALTGWNTNKEYEIGSTEQFTFSGDYVLDNSHLYIGGSEERIGYSQDKLVKKVGKIYIGGNLILRDSSIENNGEIGVGGSVILIGNSQITGTGIII